MGRRILRYHTWLDCALGVPLGAGHDAGSPVASLRPESVLATIMGQREPTANAAHAAWSRYDRRSTAFGTARMAIGRHRRPNTGAGYNRV